MVETRPALSVRGLSAGYGAREILHEVDLDISAGVLTGVIGPNGAGKSTFLKAILGPTFRSGRITLAGRPLRDLRPIAYVPQRASIDFTFPITAAEVALQGTYATLPWWRRPRRADREWALTCLDQVGLADAANTPIGALSGGQAARVFIARALAQRPQVYLLDEPFAAIDAASAHKVLSVLRRQAQAGAAVVVVHHNLDQVQRYFTDLIVLGGQKVVTGPVTEVFTTAMLAQAFPGAHALAHLARIDVEGGVA